MRRSFPHTTIAMTVLIVGAAELFAQTTSFTYQGQFQDGGAPANGVYDLTFEVFDAATSGTSLGVVTNVATVVSNGLFTVAIDFGAGVFDGGDRWLEIGAVTNGGGVFVTLSPRQPIDATPYAIMSAYAMTVDMGYVNNPMFLGTTNGTPLVLSVNNDPALRIEGTAGTPNLVGGYSGNVVAVGGEGSMIAGGGSIGGENAIGANSDYGAIGGGQNNVVSPDVDWATIGGGISNVNGGVAATIGGGNGNKTYANDTVIAGGVGNRIEINSNQSAIGGGGYNAIGTNSWFSSIGGGRDNAIGTNSYRSSIGGGAGNRVGMDAWNGVIGGGYDNRIEDFTSTGTIGGGRDNVLHLGAWIGTIGGGWLNAIQDLAGGSTVAGGLANIIGTNSDYAVIGGGHENFIQNSATYSTISGGYGNNIADASYESVIGGGRGNEVGGTAPFSTISGGRDNTVSERTSLGTIGGGQDNTIGSNAWRSTIGGGYLNRIDDESQGGAIDGGYLHAIGINADYAAIGGGSNNTIGADSAYALIGGGEECNRAGFRSSPGGGWLAQCHPIRRVEFCSGRWTVEYGGYEFLQRNHFGGGVNVIDAASYHGAIGGGFRNTIDTNSYAATIAGGEKNVALSGWGATVGGGAYNTVKSIQYGTISGGRSNEVWLGGSFSAVGGGELNRTTSSHGTVPGGYDNSAGRYSFAAGRRAKASFSGSFVWADPTDADFFTTSTNQFLIRASGGVAIGTNDPGGAALCVVGDIKANNFVGMGAPMMLGTSDAEPLDLKVNSTRGLRLAYPSAGTTPNLIGGYSGNSIGSATEGAAIAGGGELGFVNTIADGASFSAIGGGRRNTIEASASTSSIGGGDANRIGMEADDSVIGGGAVNAIESNATHATIAGGVNNDIGASSIRSVIGGGFNNDIGSSSDSATIAGGVINKIHDSASGSAIGGGIDNVIADFARYAVIPGGSGNGIGADADYAFAAGRRAQADDAGTFVWADSTDADFTSTGSNQFLIRASGGVGIGTTSPDVPLHVAGGVDTGLGGGGYLVLGDPAGENVSIDNNEIMARFNGASDTLFLNNGSGPVAIGSGSSATDYKVRVNGGSVGGAYILASAAATSPAILRLESSSAAGVVLHALHNSSTSTAVVVNRGAGDLVSGYNGPTGGNLVYTIDNDGDVTAKSFNPSSDRRAKEDVEPAHVQDILRKVVSMPINHWRFIGDPVRHVGPMAQDFYAAFGVGPDNRHIATVDADGVALAAIQGLHQMVEQKDAEIAKLKTRMERLEQKLNETLGGDVR